MVINPAPVGEPLPGQPGSGCVAGSRMRLARNAGYERFRAWRLCRVVRESGQAHLACGMKGVFNRPMPGPDERDTIFSRMELEAGGKRYEEYYAAHPGRKASDDAARAAIPPRPAGEARHRLVDGTFALLEELRPLARGASSPGRLGIAPGEATGMLRELAESYGAVLFGTALLGDACFYSTRGRGAEYGEVPGIPFRQGIVFAVRMRPGEIAFAPEERASAEVVRCYAQVALIGLVIARCVRTWGWEAVCTMDGRADVVLPVAARYAGLGSIGRSGLLVTDDYGPCVRLGAVLTDLPLERTPRQACAASRACSGCERCADSCPAGAIARGAPGPGGFPPVDDDACFAAWKTLGTDCGLCIAACPLSHIQA